MVGAALRPAAPQARRATRTAAQVAAVASPVKPASGAKPGKAPTITKEEAAAIYHDMVLGREFEEMCAQMYYRGKMFGFVHLYSGQEAVSTGACRASFLLRHCCCCCLLLVQCVWGEGREGRQQCPANWRRRSCKLAQVFGVAAIGAFERRRVQCVSDCQLAPAHLERLCRCS